MTLNQRTTTASETPLPAFASGRASRTPRRFGDLDAESRPAKPFRLRAVSAAPDLDAIHKLRIAAWRSVNTCLPSDCPTSYREGDDARSIHVAAFVGETLVGAARLRIHAGTETLPLLGELPPSCDHRFTGPVGYMSRLVVHPGYRRQGIARDLVAWMMCRAQKDHADWAVALTNVQSMRDMLVARGFGCIEPLPLSWGQSTVTGSFLWRRLTAGEGRYSGAMG